MFRRPASLPARPGYVVPKKVAGSLATAIVSGALGGLAVLSSAYGVSVFAETSTDSSVQWAAQQKTSIPQKRATHPEIAKKNLNHSLERARRLSASWPNSPVAAKGVVDLLLMRLQFYRDYADLDELQTLCERWENDARAEAQYLCADVDAARHDFVGALTRITRASKRGGSCKDARRRVAAIGATLHVDTNLALTSVEEILPVDQTLDTGYANSVVLAALATAKDQPQKAAGYYRKAVSEYADVSPYPIAWAWHQTAELLREHLPLQAAEYYTAALEYLPDYLAPRIELAALQIEQGNAAAALENLQIAATLSADPDIDGLIAEALTLSSPTFETQIAASRQNAAVGFERLLKRHPYAFADHAAEVFAELDTKRANELRLMLRTQKQEVTSALEDVDC